MKRRQGMRNEYSFLNELMREAKSRLETTPLVGRIRGMRMLQDLEKRAEQLQHTAILRRYLPPALAERFSIGNTLTQVRRKNLTVFFSDIRGFSAMSEEMEPEELVHMLNRYFQEMTQIIFYHGGTLGSFLGDGIMGFFGYPVEHPDHALRAIKMSLEMESKLKELNSQGWFNFPLFAPLQIGIGINTGYVTLGYIGSESHRDYTIVGTNVNLTSRLEEMALPGQILISQRTYNLVRDDVEVEEVGEFTLKGFHSQVSVYNVLSLKQTS
jgi:class 3 adenylate cyclase